MLTALTERFSGKVAHGSAAAGESIQQWLDHTEEGDPAGYEAAWRQIMADNPFPAVIGRVCYRPCETACNRAQLSGTTPPGFGWRLPAFLR